MKMIDRAILTSCSNKFFPAVINLIGSIEKNYPNHPPIYIFDQGIWPVFRKELEKRENVTVLPIPAFCPHWKSCYTWKPYIFAHAPARLNIYIDSGYQAISNFDEIFNQIEENDYFVIDQNLPLEMTIPEEYKNIFSIEEKFYKESYVTAGFWGFKTGSKIDIVIKTLYESAVVGLLLGFSTIEKWRNKGKNKNPFVRNCKLFRHDTSIFSIIMRKELKNFIINPREKYDLGEFLNNGSQTTFNARLKYVDKENIKTKTVIAGLYIKSFLLAKNIINKIKN